MNIHLIAIGGSAMHNMAIALRQNGYNVTGSDDNIFEPSRSRLERYDLLPSSLGWYPNNITNKLDAIIVGMHARKDNPELLKAQELNIPIYSYPEYIYEKSKKKKRIVIGGSHGKTSITAMILHVLRNINIDCDYMVGAQLDGFETMVKLTDDTNIILLEGDEYLSSPIDRRPKFHLYQPHIAVISGIAWDHINVFPTLDNYIEQFRIFKNMVKDILIYFKDDKELSKLMCEPTECKIIPYNTPDYKIINGKTIIRDTQLLVFGIHNLQNINAARLVCKELGILDNEFFQHISTFKGASNRLELVKSTEDSLIYKDFAHSPSKLKATAYAMKMQYNKRRLIACIELHTFSSLNKEFLEEYSGKMNDPDIAIVYFNPEAIKHKKLKAITKDNIYNAFGRKDLLIFTNSQKLEDFLKAIDWKDSNLLMMSSGNFNGIKLENIY